MCFILTFFFGFVFIYVRYLTSMLPYEYLRNIDDFIFIGGFKMSVKRCFTHTSITWMCVREGNLSAQQLFFFSSINQKVIVLADGRRECLFSFDLDLICIHFLCADVIDLSSSEDDRILHSQKKKKVQDEKEEEEAVSEPSGAHTNDALNQPDAEGRVLVNFNHPAGEKDIFLSPQLARAVKPHQVPSPKQAASLPSSLSIVYFSLLSTVSITRWAESASCTTTWWSRWSGSAAAAASDASWPTAWAWARRCRSSPSSTSSSDTRRPTRCSPSSR